MPARGGIQNVVNLNNFKNLDSPLTLPSPARGEGKHIEIEKKFPPPRRGRERVGVKK
jgi:hypothetical protein